jgi:oligosaccharide repeat unit polymerase
MVGPTAATNGTYAVVVAFGGLAIGRHFVSIKESVASDVAVGDLTPSSVFSAFILVTFFGYLHIFLAVDFDFFEVVRQMLQPRFTQAWARGQYGDASALLSETGALINLVPPIAGLVFGRARQYSVLQKAVVVVVLAFTVFFGFASGTRSAFVSPLLTFTGVYLITKPQLRFRQALTIGTVMSALLFAGNSLMLQIRTTGLGELSSTDASGASFYVDLNIVNVARLTDKFPDVYGYLGLEIPYIALIRPIPRVLWPGKPTGLSVPIETALDALEGLTVSCTYIGEAYMSGGLFAVLILSMLFGAATEMWNRVGLSSYRLFNQIVYVSGFLCPAMAARSMLGMVPVMLPTLALWIFGRIWLSRPSSPAKVRN